MRSVLETLHLHCSGAIKYILYWEDMKECEKFQETTGMRQSIAIYYFKENYLFNTVQLFSLKFNKAIHHSND